VTDAAEHFVLLVDVLDNGVCSVESHVVIDFEFAFGSYGLHLANLLQANYYRQANQSPSFSLSYFICMPCGNH
jgi:hypothetical protein